MITAANFPLEMVRGCTWEAIEFQMLDGDGDPVNIAGFHFDSEVRAQSGSPVIVDLNPTIVDALNGIVRLPSVSKNTTPNYPAGNYKWDFLATDGSSNEQQLIKGKFKIANKITDS